MKYGFLLLLIFGFLGCKSSLNVANNSIEKPSFLWGNATVYALAIGQFNNGDPTNDKGEKGDIQGVVKKIKDGYFYDLGVDVIRLSSLSTVEPYGYLNPNYGKDVDVIEMIGWAHQNGIRVVIDVIMNESSSLQTAELIQKFGFDGICLYGVNEDGQSIIDDYHSSCVNAYRNWKKDNPKSVIKEGDFAILLAEFHEEKFDNVTACFNISTRKDIGQTAIALHDKYALVKKRKPLSIHCLNTFYEEEFHDLYRKFPIKDAAPLLFSPGPVQILYGEETARSFSDFMNWDELMEMKQKNGYTVNDVMIHWKKIGGFRKMHPSIGAGDHQVISTIPYMFTRTLKIQNRVVDQVLIGIGMEKGNMMIDVSSIAADGDSVEELFSGTTKVVQNGNVLIDSTYDIVMFLKSK